MEAVITKQFHLLSVDPGGIVSSSGIRASKEDVKVGSIGSKTASRVLKDTERNYFCSLFFSFMYSGYGENSI